MAASRIDLSDEFEDSWDPRGLQYPLVPVLAPGAILAGRTAFAALAQFGRLRRHRVGHARGFRAARRPAATTPALGLHGPDAAHRDRLLCTYLSGPHAAGWDPSAVDGKTPRGSRDGDVPAVATRTTSGPTTTCPSTWARSTASSRARSRTSPPRRPSARDSPASA